MYTTAENGITQKSVKNNCSLPLGRLGEVQDIGAVCASLAADEAAWISGETIQVTGGSRLPVGYLAYMHHITEQLAGQGKPVPRGIAPCTSNGE
jgi:hypothetical protein